MAVFMPTGGNTAKRKKGRNNLLFFGAGAIYYKKPSKGAVYAA